MHRRIAISTSTLVVLAAVGLVSSFQVKMSSQTSSATAAHDPGPRAGDPAAGNPIAGLTAKQAEYFRAGKVDFSEAEQPDEGLGPRMSLDSCAGCHLQPAVGGSSPPVNPQIAFAAAGGHDGVPSFLTADGPVREVRYVSNPDGTPDGGVHALFTITGRPGATGCTMNQPDFETQAARHNVIFRIPTPTFGLGLIEQIPDSAILQNQGANAATKSALG